MLRVVFAGVFAEVFAGVFAILALLAVFCAVEDLRRLLATRPASVLAMLRMKRRFCDCVELEVPDGLNGLAKALDNRFDARRGHVCHFLCFHYKTGLIGRILDNNP